MRESWREEIWKCDINKKDPPQGDDIPWLCIKKVTQNLSWPGNSLKPILRDGLLSGRLSTKLLLSSQNAKK
jgi:hypothetical protein